MLKTLIKIRILEMFSGMRTKGGRSLGMAGMIILMFFAGISFLFLFGTMAFGLILGLAGTDYKWLYFGIMAILVFMLSFIGTVFMTKQQMFEAKDNSTLLSMPIKSRDILLSRVLSIGLMNYGLAFLISLPFGVVYAIFGRFNILGAVFFLLGVIILPLFALACSMLFGWLLAVLNRRMKHKKVFSMFFSTIFLLAYFYLCFSWTDRLEELIAHGEEVAAALSKFLPPIYHFGNAAASGSIISFLIFAAICLIPFVVVITIVSKKFVDIVTTESSAAKVEYKGGEMKSSSEFMSLASIELKRFTSSTTYMLNAGMGLLFIVIVAVMLLVKQTEVLTVVNQVGPFSRYIAPGIIVAILYMSALTIISTGTISLEAKTLWLPKSLPVEPKNVLLSKMYPHVVISLPVILISCIIMQIPFKLSVIERIMVVLIPVVGTLFNAIIGVMVNLAFPKFNWVNEAQAIKQGVAPLLSMFVSSVPAIIFTLLAIVVGATSIMSIDIYLIVFFLLYTGATFFLYRWLVKKGTVKFIRLQNN